MKKSKLKVFLVAGARPNFMKIAPLYNAMTVKADVFEPIIVHTGQHYDENMSKIFFEQLELPRPDIYLEVGSGSHAQQTAEIMRRFEPEIANHAPHIVLVVGDVNSTIACALTAIKSRIHSANLNRFWQLFESFLENRSQRSEVKEFHRERRRSSAAPIIAHVESGERSFDMSMPEEINRITTDVLSDLLFTTCDDSSNALIDEGIDPRKIFMLGNIMIDSLLQLLPKATDSNILSELNSNRPDHIEKLDADGFILTTLHRAGNVDEADVLMRILSALIQVSQTLPVVFPVHPRTRKLISELDETFLVKMRQSRILLTDPAGYLDFLHLQTQARLVLTDSGGVQVESSYLGVPCLTLRPNTEWRITLREGTNRLVFPDTDAIVQAAADSLSADKPHPARIRYWDGQTANRIIDLLIDIFELA